MSPRRHLPTRRDLSRRGFLGTSALLALGACTGCGDGTDLIPAWGFDFGGWDTGRDPEVAGPFDVPAAQKIDLVRHVAGRVSFGLRPDDYGRIRGLGATQEDAARAFLEEQLAPESIEDESARLIVRRLETLDEPVGMLFEFQPDLLLRELSRGALLRAVYSRRQLFEVMVSFWTDHFNIDVSKGDCRWLKTADDRDVVRAHALGSFPELLRASATSPAMLWYLDGRTNRRRTPDERPNENYARELLELHTLGVDGGYTQQDVMEVARCLTGWTVRSEEKFFKGRVEFRPDEHDNGAKTVLGHRIPSGLGRRDLDRVLDLVALHPSTARFLATKLCRRFIATPPPTNAVDVVAQAFLDSRGDIRSTLRALFQTPEFFDEHSRYRGNRLKRPFHFVVSALRTTGAQTRADDRLLDYLLSMGQAPFQHPTPDGYPEEETPWLGTLVWRWKFAVALAENRIPDVSLRIESLLREFGDLEDLARHVLGRQPTAAERSGILRSASRGPQALALLVASPAFQRF
ncbi:MAG: DUF1800 domain-containing protein [Thermoanaerobaculia bacterium]|nr:DUF1800 domain-containing protein [Thermoanaerobaculia bacterium]